MPRIARGLADDTIYHVINRGNGKQEIFHKHKDYESFIKLMKEAKGRYNVRIFAYCIMPNHFHAVLMPTRGEDLSRWMQWLMTSHVRRYHRHYRSSGHIWQGRYKSFMIEKNKHLLMVLRYPVRAGLVKTAIEWRWSSHREAIGDKARILLDEMPMELPDDWNRYVNETLKEKEIDRLRQSVNRQSPYGNRGWQEQMCKLYGIESSIRPRGRPRRGLKK